MEHLIIRKAQPEEWDEAMELAFRVFLKFEAKDYGQKGTEAFAEFVTDPNLKKAFETGHYMVYLAFVDDKLVGISGLRGGNHISLLFVDEKYQKMGIGSRLLDRMTEYIRESSDFSKMTVNAAPTAAGFYHVYGFTDSGEETEKDGIIYIPMEKTILF